jgi:hypothetical protein
MIAHGYTSPQHSPCPAIAAHELTIPLTVNLVSAGEAAAAGSDAEVTEEVVILKVARAQRRRPFLF